MKYEIERKSPGQDNFIKVGEVRASGASFITQTRSYEDNLHDVPTGTVTYRIKQIVDSSSTGLIGGYIDTTVVATTGNCFSGLNSFILAPNPTKGPITLRLTTPNSSQNIAIRVFNSIGQVTLERKTSKPIGLVILDIPVLQLPAGKYFVSVYDGNTRIGTQSLIKL